MTELTRWSEGDATPEERALIEAARRERAPRSARVQTLAALGIGTTVAATTSVGAAGAATAAAAGGVALPVKIVGIAVVVLGVGAAGVARHAQRRLTAAPPVTAVAPSRAETVDQSASPAPAITPTAAPSAAETSVALAPKDVGRHAAPAAGLAAEVSALERAHAALAAHDPDGALRALDRYVAQFPRGELASEATVLRVQALLARGDEARARALADAYAAAHPQSPYTRRIRELVHGPQK